MLVTNQCNLSCRYCFSIVNLCKPQEFLTVENAIKLLSNINVPVSSISLSGGEPFLHPELFQLYTLFQQNYPTWITTNGTITRYDIPEKLFTSSGIFITVSLNAINQDIDHLLRGTYCKVKNILKNILILITLSEKFKVNTIVSHINLNELNSIGSFLAQININNNLSWNLLQFTTNSNSVSECSDLLITSRKFRETVSNLQEIFGKRIRINTSTSEELERNCYMIIPSGDVFNMKKSNKLIGNILKNKLDCII